MAERVFLREVNLDQLDKSLLLYQSSIGNVSVVLWDAALVLAKFLNKRARRHSDWLRGLKVLELGSGVGCVGITAACFGADAILTDLPEVVPQLLKTMEVNRFAISSREGKTSAMELVWGESCEPILEKWKEPPNLILMSDCIYYEDAIKPLIETLKTVSDTRTEILISQEVRDHPRYQRYFDSFMSLMREDFVVQEIPEEDQDEVYHSVDIQLFQIYKK